MRRNVARMTPQLLAELIAIHSSCVHDQEGRCPLLVSVNSLCWELNQAMGCANSDSRTTSDPASVIPPSEFVGDMQFDPITL